MRFDEIVKAVADVLQDLDSECPTDQAKYQPGIGPFREVRLVKEVSERLTKRGISGQGVVARTHKTPDMSVRAADDSFATETWALEFKIVRPFGDNGNDAENWSQNLLHPYEGNVSLMGDALKLLGLSDPKHSGLLAICYQHDPPLVDLEPLLTSFELISQCVLNIPLGQRIEENRLGLVHPVHQVVRCVGWQLEGQET